MDVRPARPDELPAVMGVLNAGYLDVDAGTVRTRIADRDVLVAADADRVLGALVLLGAEVTAVAVRPGRRDQGVGTALIEAAADRVDGPVTAEFDPSVRPFYETLGFTVEPTDDDGRLVGRRE